MSKVLVLYYSTYGHIGTMAKSVAEGARSVAGTEVTVKRVPELMPEDVARKAGVKLDQEAPIAKPEELADYDAVIFGTPTRFGNMAAQRSEEHTSELQSLMRISYSVFCLKKKNNNILLQHAHTLITQHYRQHDHIN